MRRSIVIVAALLVTALPAPAQGATVTITELLADPGSGREFIELHATGPVDITGWTIDDAAGTTFTFGATMLESGQRLVVWGGGEPDARGPAWSRATVWNNGGDVATLRDATGTIIDVLAYGSATWPDGRNQSVPPAPATGRSLSLLDGRWIEAHPTPGTPTQSSQHSVTATVENAPPSATLSLPAEAAPGEAIVASLAVEDSNGDAIAWELSDHAGRLANGTGSGAQQVTLVAPTDRDLWSITLTASDGTANTTIVRTVTLDAAGLTVILPPEGLAFPSMLPGQAIVESANFTIRNDATEPLRPIIDVSDLTGPATIPVEGRLLIGNGTTWTSYDGALTRLPTIAPGAAVEVRFRLLDLPAPLPAGEYGTSFTVIA